MLKPGDTFERYTIEAAIGQGGMGCVYRAHDARLGRRVALKVISERAPGEDAQGEVKARAEADARLLREARAAASLDHPNAVAVFDVGELEGAPYIVMELVSGSTVRSSIGDTAVPVDRKIAWLHDVARALAAAHKRGIVHRDIKPENVMVREDGVIKVLDFGIARRAGGDVEPNASTARPALPTLTVEGVKLGTPVYMAPEQIRGEALDGRTDQFAWGVLAFELLTGRLPWRGSSDAFAVVASILTDEIDGAALDRASVPPDVRDVVLRALAKRPDNRFATMDDAVQALASVGPYAASNPGAPHALEAAARGEAAPAVRGSTPVAPAQSATMAQRYSTQDVQEVLARAIEQQAAKKGDAKLGFEDLLAAAREVGIDADTLREASRALRNDEGKRAVGEATAAEHARWLRQKRVEFLRHGGVYVIVLSALLALGLLIPFLTPYVHFLWIVALLWGIGVAIHGLVLATSSEDELMAEKQGMQWWLEERRRHHELAMARVSSRFGVAPPERATMSGQRRDEVPPEPEAEAEPAPPKVRVAMDTAREQMAEEEAAIALAEDRKVKQKSR